MGTESERIWTVNLVIEEAAKRARWFITDLGLIRREGDDPKRRHAGECPVSCLIPGGGDAFDAPDIARQLGISAGVYTRIVSAADGRGYPNVRRRMLAAFHLQEEGE